MVRSALLGVIAGLMIATHALSHAEHTADAQDTWRHAVGPGAIELPELEDDGTSGIQRNKKSAPPPKTDNAADEEPEETEIDPHAADLDAIDVPDAGRATTDDIRYGKNGLPANVAQSRKALMDAARTGQIEALRPVFSRHSVPPLVDPMSAVADPVAHLKLQSGDDDGHEILAILLEILETGHVEIREGSRVTYVWPYFAEVPLHTLKSRHLVEVYRLLTSVDVEEMERLGRYTFFRLGIAEDGRVRYFSAGDLE